MDSSLQSQYDQFDVKTADNAVGMMESFETGIYPYVHFELSDISRYDFTDKEIDCIRSCCNMDTESSKTRYTGSFPDGRMIFAHCVS